VIVISGGRLLADASVADLLASTADSRVDLRTPERVRVMALLAAEGATVSSTGSDTVTVHGLTAGRIGGLVSAAGLPLETLTPRRPTLEDAYFRLTRGAAAHDSGAVADVSVRS